MEKNIKKIEQIFIKLCSSQCGISNTEAAARLKKYGKNVLPEQQVNGYVKIFIQQFYSPLIYLLIGAAIFIFLMGEVTDALVVGAVLLLNAMIGTIQEGRARNTLLALKKMAMTKVTVMRDGKEQIIDDHLLVPGDVIILYEGQKIPADARLFQAEGLRVDEAIMTGESEPVDKAIEGDGDASVGIVLKGTLVVGGHGSAVVTATGLETQLGKIALQLQDIDEVAVPLKANIARLSNLILTFVGIVSAIIFLVGLYLGQSLRTMLMTIVALAVSMIPEGLPIVMTLVLARSVWRMSKNNVLVKKLHAVEALGQAEIIAVDKTGTLTKNELTIAEVANIDGVLYRAGAVNCDEDEKGMQALLALTQSLVLCSQARVFNDQKAGVVAGDPLEVAILRFGQHINVLKDDLLKMFDVKKEIPFRYERKYRGALYKDKNGSLLCSITGAPEVILGMCSRVMNKHGESESIDQQLTEKINSRVIEMSERGLRVLAVAYGMPQDLQQEEGFSQFLFLGLVGFYDDLRPEVTNAMVLAKAAGVRVVMITGDHKVTACSIARKVGIFDGTQGVLTGDEIAAMSADNLRNNINNVSVFARVNPVHKLAVIKAFRESGSIVAMTGDGVNDAPSLVAADLGVAMGVIGADVAKEAADLILLDDNFGNIVLAIEEGRGIYKTIQIVVQYLAIGAVSQAATIFLTMVFGCPLPLLAAHIIWLNFVTDGFLDVALAMEPHDEELLKKKFKKPSPYIITKNGMYRILWNAIPLAFISTYVFSCYALIDLWHARSVALTVLVCGHLVQAWNCRSTEKSFFSLNPLRNGWLVVATFLVVGFQAAALYTPWLQKILRTVPLNFIDIVYVVLAGFVVLCVDEIRKYFRLFSE